VTLNLLKRIAGSREEVFFIEGVSPQDLNNAAEKEKVQFRLSDYVSQSLTLKILVSVSSKVGLS
jgi:hypothetical protein